MVCTQKVILLILVGHIYIIVINRPFVDCQK